MCVKRVEVLVRAGEVVVVLDSAAELRAVLDRMPGEAVEVDRQPPKAAAGSRVEAAGAQVHVPVQLWGVMRSLLCEAEGMHRAALAGSPMIRRDVLQWLTEVDALRQEWVLRPMVDVSSQVAEA
jgi:hypothetical protein